MEKGELGKERNLEDIVDCMAHELRGVHPADLYPDRFYFAPYFFFVIFLRHVVKAADMFCGKALPTVDWRMTSVGASKMFFGLSSFFAIRSRASCAAVSPSCAVDWSTEVSGI